MGERPGPHQVVGGIVACLGLILIAWPRLTGSGAVPFLMTVVAAASWGVANIISKRAGRIDMLGFVVWSSLVAPMPLLGLSLWLDGPDRVSTALTQIDGGTLRRGGLSRLSDDDLRLRRSGPVSCRAIRPPP